MARPRTRPDTPAIARIRRNDLASYYRKPSLLGWAQTALQNLKKRAKRRGLPVSVTIDDILRVAEHATHCPITGEPLIYARGMGYMCGSTASIDRIDNDLGYTPDSIAVISVRANTLKSNCSLDEMINVGKYAATMKARASVR